MLPKELRCPNCGVELELEHRERVERRFVCPSCQSEIDLREELLEEETDIRRQPDVFTQLQKAISSIFLSVQPLERKILITLAGIVIYRLGFYIPAPGINTGLFNDFFYNTTSALLTHSIFSLGIRPYIIASILVIPLGGVIPCLKRLRDGPVEQRYQFDMIVYIATIIISVLQAERAAEVLSSIDILGRPLINSGWGSHLIYVLSLTSSTMLLVWIADQITKRGIVNGVVLFFLIDILAQVIPSIIRIIRRLSVPTEGVDPLMKGILLLIVYIALIGFSIVIVKAKRNIPLKRISRRVKNEKSRDTALPIRINKVGIFPIEIGQKILFIPTFLIIAFPKGISPGWQGNLLDPKNWPYWLGYGISISLLTYLYSVMSYDSKGLANKIERYRFKIVEGDLIGDVAKYLHKIVETTIIPGAIFLCGIAIIPFVISVWFDVGLNSFLGYFQLFVIASCIDIYRQFRWDFEITKGVKNNKNLGNVEWVPVFTGQTVIEGEMVREILYESGIGSFISSNQVISALGTLAFWGTRHPTYPTLKSYQRLLGQELMEVLVPLNRVEEAEEILKSRGIV